MQHKNFFMVPNRIFDLELKPRDFTVYCCLLRHSDSKDGSCFPSRRVIAKECGMDRKTVDSAIENLSSLGLVKKVQRHREDGTRTSNLYYVASLLEQSKSFFGIVSEFPIKKKTHRTKPRNYYNRKREQITTTERPCVAHRPPVCRGTQRCEETPDQKENRPFEAILGQGWKGEFRNATRRILGIFDGSKIKQPAINLSRGK